jgi:hypothetical protein
MPRKGIHYKPAEERKGPSVMVRLTPAENDALRKLARRRKLPLAYFIREGIRFVIERESV